MEEKEKLKLCFFDIEADFKRRLLNIGFASGDGKIREEYWIWQREEMLYYPSNEEKDKYIKILEIWRNKVKTPIADIIERLLTISKDYVLAGWNVANYDVGQVCNKYLRKHNVIEQESKWEPLIMDSYLGIKEYIQLSEHKRLRKRLREFNEKFTANTGKTGEKGMLTAETMFRWVTGCTGYIEKHTALYDAEDERHITRMLVAKYGTDIYNFGKRNFPVLEKV